MFQTIIWNNEKNLEHVNRKIYVRTHKVGLKVFFITQVINWQEGHADSEPYIYHKTLFPQTTNEYWTSQIIKCHKFCKLIPDRVPSEFESLEIIFIHKTKNVFFFLLLKVTLCNSKLQVTITTATLVYLYFWSA